MKKILSLLLFINICTANFCQLIRGFVVDQDTREPISFASVYFNGTSAGTNTGEKGYFELDISKFRSMPLSVSALGYYTVTLTRFLNQDPLRIYMVPKVFELGEISVTDKNLAKAKERNMRLFRREFLGTTPNAAHCTILNEKAIRFNYYWDKDTLRAYSREPVIIDNASLGYRITYFLDNFAYDRRTGSLSFSGNILFKDEISSDSIIRSEITKRRSKAFLGSRMHFFRALWTGDLVSEGFTIRNSVGNTPNYENLIEKKDSVIKEIKFPEQLFIYYDLSTPAGIIKLLKNEVVFDSNGYFDPSGISWEGPMSEKRIADWLPYEYEPEAAKNTSVGEIIQ